MVRIAKLRNFIAGKVKCIEDGIFIAVMVSFCTGKQQILACHGGIVNPVDIGLHNNAASFGGNVIQIDASPDSADICIFMSMADNFLLLYAQSVTHCFKAGRRNLPERASELVKQIQAVAAAGGVSHTVEMGRKFLQNHTDFFRQQSIGFFIYKAGSFHKP